MSTPFTTLTSVAAPLIEDNIDTDIIIPSREMKSTGKTGLAAGLFAGRRYTQGRSENPDFVLNQSAYRAAAILLAGDNFGCGSSREHAPWALADMGLRAIIAPSFADIFSGNSFKNGLLLVVLPQAAIDRLMEVAATDPVTIDLENQVVTTPFQDRFSFEIDPFRKHCLVNGLDEIGLTVAMDADIAAHEARLAGERAWIAGAAGSTGIAGAAGSTKVAGVAGSAA